MVGTGNDYTHKPYFHLKCQRKASININLNRVTFPRHKQGLHTHTQTLFFFSFLFFDKLDDYDGEMIDEVDEVEEILSRMCPVVAQPSLSATTDQSSSFSASFDQPYLSASAGQPVSTSQLAQSPHLGVDPNITAEKEEATVLAYMTNTCGCQLHNNGPCSQQFTVDYVLQARMDAAELSKSELDICD